MPPETTATTIVGEEYILDDGDLNFPSYGILREGGTLLGGNEESETIALFNAVADNLPIRVRRENDPVNEHECFSKLLLGAFPYLFITGTGLPLVGGVSKKLIKHMLLQGDGRFAGCSNFIYTVFNYDMRKKASIGASLQINRHPHQMQQFADFIRDPETPQNIQNAINDPSNPASQVRWRKNISVKYKCIKYFYLPKNE